MLGDFDGASFDPWRHDLALLQARRQVLRPHRRAGRPAPRLRDRYTFGVDPLQQYLIAFPDGRLQALGIAWDSAAQGQGGQRWFHLYPDQTLAAGDPLHWTGIDQNWNFMCAECHSTDLRKNYDAATDTYATTWSEIDVACEACHGPGSAHVAWAERQQSWLPWGKGGDDGLTVHFDEREGVPWTIDPGHRHRRAAARRGPAPRSSRPAACAIPAAPDSPKAGARASSSSRRTCRPCSSPACSRPTARCATRSTTTPRSGRARCSSHGVTCSDCHDPHSLQLRAEATASASSATTRRKYDAVVAPPPCDGLAGGALRRLPHAGADLHGGRSAPRSRLPDPPARQSVRFGAQRLQRLPRRQGRRPGRQPPRALVRTRAQGLPDLDRDIRRRPRRQAEAGPLLLQLAPAPEPPRSRARPRSKASPRTRAARRSG